MSKLIAHRGLKDEYSENTIEAFKKAIENEEFAGFECDVRTTKDGIFIINHNPIVNDKIISLSNFKNLKKPTLEEVLSLKTKKIILLEIKEINLNVQAFLKVINKHQDKNIYIMSFHNQVIKKLNQANHFYKLGVLNYLLNSEESYQDYDFICLLEKIMAKDLADYFAKKNIETFIYGIHNLDKLVKEYPLSYLITD